MKVSDVLIHNYKSICSDVAECKILIEDRVTFLIGANESGKTNILEAMVKFTRGGFTNDDIPQMCELYGQTEIPDDLPMVSVTYKIEGDDREELKRINPGLHETNEITITRNYKGDPYISGPDLKVVVEIDRVFKDLENNYGVFAKNFRRYLRAYKKTKREVGSPTQKTALRFTLFKNDILKLFGTKDINIVPVIKRRISLLRIALSNLAIPLDSLGSEVLRPLAELENMVNILGEGSEAKKASNELWKIVPKFSLVPADPRLWLIGDYMVDNLLSNKVKEELESVKRLLLLGNLDLKTIRGLKDEVQRSRLDQGSRKITKIIRGIWKQEEDIQIKLDWSSEEGNKKLLVMVDSTGHSGFPQFRSYGFRWFLEFYLLYAVALQSDIVLLLEEPGIHLHLDAQEYLKSLIRDTVANNNQVIYTTHLPDMYDLANPEGCRAVEKDVKKGGVTAISSSYSPESQHATWEVAMRASGASSPSLRVYNRCLIVEGPSDWIFLLTMAQVLAREEPKLVDMGCGFIHIRHYQGTGGILQHVQFHFQPGARSVIVLDSDDPGRRLKQKLNTELGIPNEWVNVLLLDECKKEDESRIVEGDQNELEDLFGKKYYAELVANTIGKDKKITEKDIKVDNMIADQAIKIAKKKYDITLRKDDVAWSFRKQITKGETQIPEEAKNKFKSLLLNTLDYLQ